MANDFYKDFKKRIRERLGQPRGTAGQGTPARPLGASLKSMARKNTGLLRPPELK
jgi:hypothetical protein